MLKLILIKKKKNYQNNHYNYFIYSMFFKVQIYFG